MTWQTFANIRGHAAQVGTLLRIVGAEQPAHAYLFEGPSGVGKQAVAWALAARLACLQAEGSKPACGDCRSCHALQRGEHPDIACLSRDGATIKIGQVRDALKRLRYEAVLGAAKVLLIEDADLLREEAANALLKTLEEPGKRTHFVLVTSKPQLLLDTIRSRVQVLRFGPLAAEDVRALLQTQGVDAEDARIAAALSLGDLGRGRSLCNPELLAVVDETARFVLGLDRRSAAEAADFVDVHAGRLAAVSGGKGGRSQLDREQLAWTLDMVRAVLRDVMLAASGMAVDELPHARYGEELQAMAARVDPVDVARALQRIDQLEEDLVYNPNPRMALQAELVGAAAILRA